MRQSQSARVFLLLTASQALSLLGSRMSALAVGLWLFEAGGAVTPLALTALAAALPRLLLAGPAGLLADRADRRLVLLGAELAQALASLLLLLDLLAGSFAPWHLYALAALQSAGGALQEPALLATTARLIPPGGRTRANALLLLAGPLAAVLAPALAGLVLAAAGLLWAIAIDLLTFLVAAGVLALLRLPAGPGRPPEGAGLLSEAREGLAYLASRRDLLALFGLLGLANAVFLGAYALYPAYLLRRTGSSALAGALLALIPLGALIGGSLVALAGRRVTSRAVLPALLLSGLSLAAVGIGRSPLALGAALLALAICPAFVHAPLSAQIQDTVPDGLQGRVFAAQALLAQALTPAAYLGAGPLVDRLILPLASAPAWGLVAPLVGAGAGGAIGLLLLVGGGAVALLCLGLLAAGPAQQ